MALEERIMKAREKALSFNAQPVADTLSGVTRKRVEDVLQAIDRFSDDRRDAVFALLDDQQLSWFTDGRSALRFCDGASTAHIACHVGILQRGQRKLDREGRDYWLKPLWEIGAMEKVYFDANTGQFIPGHPVAKSSNSAYRLSDDFRAILQAPEGEWRQLLASWIQEDKIRQRLELQAKLSAEALKRVDRKHSDLIHACCKYYVPRFLVSYEVLYIDESDG